jgi:hypothetical protein
MEGECFGFLPGYRLLQSFNAVDAATDFSLAALPTFMVWGLQMKKLKKLGVAFLLGLGVT